LSLGAPSVASLGHSITLCFLASWLVLIGNAEVFWGTEWSQSDAYRGSLIATPINLSLLFGLGAAWWLTLLPNRVSSAVLISTSAVFGCMICLQRWIVIGWPIVAILCIRRQPYLLLALLAGFTSFLTFSLSFVDELVLNNFSSYLDGLVGDDNSIALRLKILHESTVAYFESPVWGLGLDHWQEGMYPHNFVVQSFTDLGIFGGIAALALFLSCFLPAWFGASASPHRKPIAVVAFMTWIHCMKAGDLTLVSLLLPLSLMSDETREISSGAVASEGARRAIWN
jgi:hypothetical protein